VVGIGIAMAGDDRRIVVAMIEDSVVIQNGGGWNPAEVAEAGEEETVVEDDLMIAEEEEGEVEDLMADAMAIEVDEEVGMVAEAEDSMEDVMADEGEEDDTRPEVAVLEDGVHLDAVVVEDAAMDRNTKLPDEIKVMMTTMAAVAVDMMMATTDIMITVATGDINNNSPGEAEEDASVGEVGAVVEAAVVDFPT